MFPVDRLTQHMAVCVWRLSLSMFPRFSYVVACVGASLPEDRQRLASGGHQRARPGTVLDTSPAEVGWGWGGCLEGFLEELALIDGPV